MRLHIFLTFAALLLLSCGKDGSGDKDTQQNAFYDDTPEEKGLIANPRFKYAHSFLVLGKKGKKPRVSDERYSSYAVYREPGHTNLNYQTFDKGLRVVDIQGAKIVLGGGDSHSVYDLIRKTNDVRLLKITVHTLVVQDEVRVAQADVEIRAHRVVFKDKGKIVTTPFSKTELPGLMKNGADGLPGGDILLLAEHIESDLEAPVLISKGGHGQPAGPGVHGARGVNAKIVHGSSDYYFFVEKCELRGTIRSGGMVCKRNEKKGWPSKNGENAKRGGRPGKGGQGGTITLSPGLAAVISFDNSGGRHGKPDIKRVGGGPGKPIKTCKRVQGKVMECVTARAGADAAPIVIPGGSAAKGESRVGGQKYHFAQGLVYYNEYAKDLYLAGHNSLAGKALEETQKLGQAQAEFSAEAFSVVQESSIMQRSLDLRLDYFGHRKGWAPKLSFAAAASLFEREGERNLKIFFLAKELLKSANELGRKQDALRELQNELDWAIQESRTSITSSVLNSSNLFKALADLETAEREFNLELARLEDEIRKLAKRKLRIPSWKKTLGMISAMSKVVPVGQPTFGALGASLDAAMALLEKKHSVKDYFTKVPSLARRFKELDMETAAGELEKKLSSLDPRQLRNMNTFEEKLEYLKEAGAFAGPLAQVFREQVSLWKEREVSSGSIQREMDKIKSSHALYQRVLKKLDILLAKKSQFIGLAKALQASVEKELVSIQRNAVAFAYIYDDIEKIQGESRPWFKKALVSLENSARRRLESYAYTLTKAYEYRYLETFAGRIDLEGFYRKASDLMAQDADRGLLYEKLGDLFRAEVSSLIEIVVLNSQKRDEMVKSFDLTDDQVDFLNNGKEIYLDFSDPGFFGRNKENIRLVSARLDEDSLVQGRFGEVVFEHLGESSVYKNGQPFFFVSDKNEAAVWISSFEGGEIRHSAPSLDSGDELRALLGLGGDIQVFALPAARSFVKMRLKGDVKLERASVRIRYSYQQASEFR